MADFVEIEEFENKYVKLALIPLGIAIASGIYYYWWFLSKPHASLFGRPCSTSRWKVGVKRLWAVFTIWRYRLLNRIKTDETLKAIYPNEEDEELEKRSKNLAGIDSDVLRVLAFDQKGNSISFSIVYHSYWYEATFLLRLANGSSYIHLNAPETIVGNSNTKKNEWEGGGLKFEILQPLKRFRLTYNGLLKKDDGSIHHVRANFIWSAAGKLIDLRNDWNPWLMGEALSREPWKQHEWYHLIKDQGLGFDQWGAMRGEVYIDSEPPIDLNLPSLRQRRWGPAEAHTLIRRLGLSGFTRDGTLFYIRATCCPLGLNYAKFGHVLFPNQKQYSISHCHIGLQNLSDNTDSRLPNNMLVTFKANRKNFRVFATLGNKENRVHGQNFIARLATIMLSVNNDCGYGVAEFWYRADSMHTKKPINPGLNLYNWDKKPKGDLIVVPFNEEECCNSNLTGGKGASLAILTSLVKDDKFEVPEGFCITTNAFHRHVRENKYLNRALALLPYLAEEDLNKGCENVMSLFKTTPIIKPVADKILQEFWRYKGVSVAVRSSAVGEDSEECSAAGQNSTFLGITGEENLLQAVQDCWASAYSFQSVQYRRQHGQIVLCKMAVVVQKMVPAEKAGVLFTRNPITGDPRNILLTANYGLGESVVSGEVDPDTTEIARSLNDEIAISTVKIGEKKQKITISEKGTKQEETSVDDTLKPCLSESEIKTLGEIAVYIDKTFDSPRDIEWAIYNEKIFLLQVRPVTSINQWTDHELLHEMDSPICSDTEIVTVANAGEVFPGATTVLTQSIVIESLRNGKETNTVKVTHHRLTVDLLATTLRAPKKEIDMGVKIGDIALIGRPFVTPELHNIALRRNGCSGSLDTLCEVLYSLKLAVMVRKSVRDSTELSKNFQMNADLLESAADLHRALTIQLSVLRRSIDYHYATSRNSIFIEAVILSLLSRETKDITDENLLDMAEFLSNSNVISADIPSSLNKIAMVVADGQNPEEFVSAKPEDGAAWLKENNLTASLMFQRFIKKHGHRGIREFDFSFDVWDVDSTSVIKMIQAIVKGKIESNREESDEKEIKLSKTPEEIIDSFKSPIQPGIKSALKYLIPICQNGVAYREVTKNNLISIVHQFRLAYRKLGQLLVYEGLLPRLDLVHHLTHYEISQLIRTRNSTLVIKAMRRQRLWPQWNKIAFPELIVGLPKPINNDIIQKGDGVTLQGCPVYPGNVLGRAVVILDLKDIDILKKGDILITHSTDVGWSPYFPLLGGIVTELGGLISHGAVVAREYGLPSLVGVANATSIIKTGDTVLLKGTLGVIEIVTSDASISA